MFKLVSRLANRDALRTEADVQADVRQLLLTAPLQLDEGDLNVNLEAQVGDRRRIDVETGSTVFEVKRDLRKGRVKADALEQLAGYVAKRITDTGRRYVGVLTDGTEWVCCHLVSGELKEVSSLTIGGAKSVWIDCCFGSREYWRQPRASVRLPQRLRPGSARVAARTLSIARRWPRCLRQTRKSRQFD